MKPLLRMAAVAALALLPTLAQANVWTAVCSTGAVDESSAAASAYNGTDFLYRSTSASVAPITQRFNVTNIWTDPLNPTMPGWTTMELGYFDNVPGASFVRAQLFEVDPCTGVSTAICQVTSVDSPTNSCSSCAIAAGGLPIDFANNLYYVLVTIDRAAANEQPRCVSLRIF